MQDALGRRHPLHITWADSAAGSGGIAVLDFTVVNNGHGFKAAMGVLADTATLFGRGELRRARRGPAAGMG